MDTGLLNLGEEHFSTCYVFEEYEGQESNSADNKSYFNEWEDEREINGDIALIPESSSFCESFNDMTNSPPSLLFQKMIDWSAFIYVEGADGLIHEASTPHPLPYQEELDVELPDDKDLKNFDIATYINEPEPANSKFRAAVKKLDVEGQKYIVEEKAETSTDDVVDVETVDGASLPVLEASDAFSLLEQFEASEKPNFPSNKSSNFEFSDSLNNIEIFDKIPKTPVDIFEDDAKLFESKIKPEKSEEKGASSPKIGDAKKTLPKQNSDYVKNKQILDALPQELIQRINESGKRKTITVIPPIPNKKRGVTRSLDNLPQHRSKIQKLANSEQVQFDHDYCASVSPYPKEPQKDSGFQSAEEDDRSVIRNQPTVKTADGKLMVSLLKVNTIRNNNQKKKLNLEEYKKRRFINSAATSQSNSPISSTCSSPLPEDENLKRLKHQEKLMKMAADLLNTPAKATQKAPQKMEEPPKIVVKAPAEIVPPPDLEVKTYLSIGTNTDISSIKSRKDLLASAKQLEEIKPLLQKVSDKINSNSFITSLIENIPKVKEIAASPVKTETEAVPEDKIIHYLKKDREPVKTRNVGSQTHFDVVDDDEDSRYRRRLEVHSPSSSSTSSSSGARRRRSSSSSRSHRSRSSSSHSSRVSSRSRSRSKSPPKKQRQYSAERMREVEERRVIYVGRIARGTIKEDLQRRFHSFGVITNISLHFREYGDNYGFVTFANKEDAYEAVEHGNDGHAYPKYDLSFGGRRLFCKTSYSDLDNMREDDYNYYQSPRSAENTFDALLRAAQEKIRKRKP